VPDPLLGLLLEQIQDLAELKVVLRGVWLRNQKRGALRAVSRREFLSDPVLLRGLAFQGAPPQEHILRGLELAVRDGVFLWRGPVRPPDGPGDRDGELYLLNTYQDRQALAQGGGEAAGGGLDSPPVDLGDAAASRPGEGPNIFALYEDNIGTFGPIIAAKLQEAETQYPAAWIAEAFSIGVAQNKRNWAYIEAILRRWAAEGKDQGKDHGEPGRHPPPDQYQKHLRDYQRRWGLPQDQGG
jgi:DnaD/phage-associated family protein